MKYIKSIKGFKESKQIKSIATEVGDLEFPEFKGDNIYMLQFDMENPILPKKYERWLPTVNKMISHSPIKNGKAYLTVDEKEITPGVSHRRGGPHVDGNFVYGFKNNKVVEVEKEYESVESWSGVPIDGGDGSKNVSWSGNSEEDDKPIDSWSGAPIDGGDGSKNVSWSGSKKIDSWSGKSQNVSWGSSGSGSTSWATGFDVSGLNESQHLRQYFSKKGGMLIASTYQTCRGWNGILEGVPNGGGDCSHLNLEKMETFLLKPKKIYLANSTFVHESLTLEEKVKRQLIRITLPEVNVLSS